MRNTLHNEIKEQAMKIWKNIVANISTVPNIIIFLVSLYLISNVKRANDRKKFY